MQVKTAGPMSFTPEMAPTSILQCKAPDSVSGASLHPQFTNQHLMLDMFRSNHVGSVPS